MSHHIPGLGLSTHRKEKVFQSVIIKVFVTQQNYELFGLKATPMVQCPKLHTCKAQYSPLDSYLQTSKLNFCVLPEGPWVEKKFVVTFHSKWRLLDHQFSSKFPLGKQVTHQAFTGLFVFLPNLCHWLHESLCLVFTFTFLTFSKICPFHKRDHGS